jgi:hypothetical protein
MMQHNEERIAKQCIRDLIDAGYEISVYDGEDITVSRSRDAGLIFAAMGTADEDFLMPHRPGEAAAASFVRFIYGNDGWDVINDYGTSLEKALARTNALVDKLAGDDDPDPPPEDSPALDPPWWEQR